MNKNTKDMENLDKYTRTFGDIDNGFYTIKTAVRNPKGELFVNYVQYIDDKKVSLRKYKACIEEDGNIETYGDPSYIKYYFN
jgi:hypothetical protein